MAKQTKRAKKQSRKEPVRPEVRKDQNSTSAEFVTVAWTLAVLSAVAAEGLAVVLHTVTLQWGPADRLQILSRTLLFTAFVAGILTLILTPVTLHLRRVPLPRPVVVSACVVGFIPILTVILLVLR